MPLVSVLQQARDAPWLTPARAKAWLLVLTLATALGVLGVVAFSRGGVAPEGQILGTDFVSFWTASALALRGASAYDPALHAATEAALFPAVAGQDYAFFYPPTYLLLCLPLALLPYLSALALWLAASLAAFVAGLRRFLPQRLMPRSLAYLSVLAFPAVPLNAGHGQNGFLTAALFAWGGLAMQTRPVLAGMALGCLVIKPHLLFALPVALLAARRFRVLAAAALSAAGLTLLSALVLGTDAWRGFFATAPLARSTLEQGVVQPWKMQSVFAAARLLHAGLEPAYAAQLAVAAIALILLARLAAQRPGPAAETALLALATLLCTPFLLDYDLMLLALPLAWLAAEGLRTAWRPWDKLLLLACYLLPLFARPLAEFTAIPATPPLLAALFALLAARVLQQLPGVPDHVRLPSSTSATAS